LPVKVGLASVPDDEVAAKRHAERLIGALARDDVPKPGNEAVRYLKQLSAWSEAFALRAQQSQIYVAAAGGGHLCAASGRRLLFVERAASRKGPADGIYAELWPVTW
ncbi:MAG: hypothetical protein HY744_00650, partial [Deltaproteobacteria bacterium]|nr:hypothetical protein [Deltaproteobacteria bacterium]